MAFDKSKFIDQFKAETLEHLQRLSEGLLKLEKMPGKVELLESMMREAHTIKGCATMMGYARLAEVAHRLEDGMERALSGDLKMDKGHFELFFRCLDTMEPLLEEEVGERGRKIEMPAVEALCREVEEVFAGKGLEIGGRDKTTRTTPGRPRCRKGRRVGKRITKKSDTRPARSPGLRERSILVETAKLDKLVNLSGELGIARLRLKKLVGDLQKKSEGKGDFSAETRALLVELSGVNDQIDGLTSTLQSETMNARTVPVAYLFKTFPRAMRDLALKKGKEVEFKITGEETRLDKRIIDEMRDPLLHLLRNAVDHGIEPPKERLKVNKSKDGEIVLSARQEGSQVVIEVSDDGRGIDCGKVKVRAVERGLISGDEASALSDDQTYQLLYTPNFSTMNEVTETSGRGVGLDVVRDKIDSLKGEIEIVSEVGRGSSFIMRLPLTLAIADSLIVASGRELFAILMENVVETLRIKAEEVRTVGTREVIFVRGEIVPLLMLDRLFEIPVRGIVERRFLHVVIVQARKVKAGLMVDALIGHQEIIRKSLAYPLKRVNNISGGTILWNGRVSLILDVPSMIESMEGPPVQETGARPKLAPAPPSSGKRILVAEDSISTAMLEKNILESAGHSVVLARDGMEALQKLEHEDIDLVMTDVLMPRMDGFELTERLKQDETRADIPVIIVTTRESDEDKRKGLEAGADAYMLKSEFTSEELLNTIDRLVG